MKEKDSQLKKIEENEEWIEFENQNLEKWLSQQDLEEFRLKEPDEHYGKVMKEIASKNITDKSSWKTEDTPERKGGFRGQKYFYECLMDMEVNCTSEFKADTNGHDIIVESLAATFDVKIMAYGKDYANIKDTWKKNPSKYYIFVKACNPEYTKFQFVGWLNDDDIPKLDFTTKKQAQGNAYFTAYEKDLNGPEGC